MLGVVVCPDNDALVIDLMQFESIVQMVLFVG